MSTYYNTDGKQVRSQELTAVLTHVAWFLLHLYSLSMPLLSSVYVTEKSLDHYVPTFEIFMIVRPSQSSSWPECVLWWFWTRKAKSQRNAEEDEIVSYIAVG